MAKAPPDGYTSITPYMLLSDAAGAIDFYVKAFGATERMRMDGENSTIMHAELEFGNAVIMLADGAADPTGLTPQRLGGSPITLLLYVEDVDSFVAKATAAGATIVDPIEDKFYGDRTATIADPFGYRWFIHTHVRDVSAEEMQSAAAAQA